MVPCAVQTDITWVKSENPVRPKTPPPKGTQTGTQTSTPQQTPTKASQARPGRSSASKNAVEIIDGVAIQKKTQNKTKQTTAPVRSASVSSRGKNIACQGSSQGTRQTETMEQDPVKVYNRFEHMLDGDLADIEMEADPVPSKS